MILQLVDGRQKFVPVHIRVVVAKPGWGQVVTAPSVVLFIMDMLKRCPSYQHSLCSSPALLWHVLLRSGLSQSNQAVKYPIDWLLLHSLE